MDVFLDALLFEAGSVIEPGAHGLARLADR